jgi:hypothetical protein
LNHGDNCKVRVLFMKRTIRKPDMGALALGPYSMVNDGGTARPMHEAGLD